MGVIYSIIAGISMSIQGVFNTRISERIGLWQANLLVHIIGLISTIIFLFFSKQGDIKKVVGVNKWYLFGGVFSAIIIFTVMQGISNLGPSVAVAVILISQLIGATVIEVFGLFGTDKLEFDITKIIGVVLMISGIIFFKIKL